MAATLARCYGLIAATTRGHPETLTLTNTYLVTSLSRTTRRALSVERRTPNVASQAKTPSPHHDGIAQCPGGKATQGDPQRGSMGSLVLSSVSSRCLTETSSPSEER